MTLTGMTAKPVAREYNLNGLFSMSSENGCSNAAVVFSMLVHSPLTLSCFTEFKIRETRSGRPLANKQPLPVVAEDWPFILWRKIFLEHKMSTFQDLFQASIQPMNKLTSATNPIKTILTPSDQILSLYYVQAEGTN